MSDSLGRVASSPYYRTIRVSTTSARLESFKPGMELRFCGPTHERMGTARIESVDYEKGELTFDIMLAAMVPAICENDYIYEYKQPCSRCRCEGCAALEQAAVRYIKATEASVWERNHIDKDYVPAHEALLAALSRSTDR